MDGLALLTLPCGWFVLLGARANVPNGGAKEIFKNEKVGFFLFLSFVKPLLLLSYLRNCPRMEQQSCRFFCLLNAQLCQVTTEMSTEMCRFLGLQPTYCS
jgi:hypothetical protein